MKILCGFLVFVILGSCNGGKDIPDVSGIKVDLKVERFEQDFFKLDTAHVTESIKRLDTKYHDFLPDFVNNILGLSFDSILMQNSLQANAIKTFIRDYKFLKDSVDKVFGNFDKEAKDIKQGLQFVKYYFPQYPAPANVITFIGPIDAFFQTSFGIQSDVKSGNISGIGLQLHMGGNFSLYTSEEGMQRYPSYISKNFTPETIPVNCMKNIVDDMYPDKSTGKPLVEQMVEKGKRLYLLDKFLPYTPEYLKISYTEKQLKESYENEAVIWDLFLNNDLLNNTEQNITNNYIGESPKTQELGEGAPGNIGSFAGWQIVKKFMSKNQKVTLKQLMEMDPREVYAESKYKPR